MLSERLTLDVAVAHMQRAVRMQLLILSSMLCALGVASWASFGHTAYDEAAPKRLLVQHAHLHVGGSVTESVLLIGGSAAVDVRNAANVSEYQQRDASYRDWQVCACRCSLYAAHEKSSCVG